MGGSDGRVAQHLRSGTGISVWIMSVLSRVSRVGPSADQRASIEVLCMHVSRWLMRCLRCATRPSQPLRLHRWQASSSPLTLPFSVSRALPLSKVVKYCSFCSYVLCIANPNPDAQCASDQAFCQRDPWRVSSHVGVICMDQGS